MTTPIAPTPLTLHHQATRPCPRNITSPLLLSAALLILMTFLSTACKPTTIPATQPAAASKPTHSVTAVAKRPHPLARTGDLKTGPKVDAAAQSIPSTGGILAVAKPGNPLDGFALAVPPGAYPSPLTFKVSSAPITSQTFGTDITPISPLITIDNGGAFSDQLMAVRVPVKVPAGYFAMGFYYDPATKQLEGMPLLSTQADAVTVGAMHFSNFFISMISKALLKPDIDSDFRPGIDDWQFPNYGSYIAQIGHCEGQSLTALWYYTTQPEGKDLCLYGRYDNNGNQPPTPDFWQDDSLGYRFASVVQADVIHSAFALQFWMNIQGKAVLQDKDKTWKLMDVPAVSNEVTWDLFAYSILATHEPQLVSLRSNGAGGHAMICYRINQGNLYVADPNYHGNTERRIEYANGVFQPYNSGANKTEIDAGKGESYGHIAYYAKSTIIPWDKIAQRWTELKNKTIGNDKFPAYTIEYKDAKGLYHELKDGYVSPNKLLDISANTRIQAGINVFRDGAELKWDARGNFELRPGNNLLGIYISKAINDDPFYIDFKYLNVVYNGLTIAPPSQSGVPNQPYAFTAHADDPPANARVAWFVDGVQKQTGTDMTFKASFPAAGSHVISVKLLDAAGKEIQTAEARADIAAEGGLLAQLQKKTTFKEILLLNGTATAKEPVFANGAYSQEKLSQSATTATGLTWKGTYFTGNINAATGFNTASGTVSGTLSPDAKTLTSLTVTATGTGGGWGNVKWTYTVKNLPVQWETSGNTFTYGMFSTALPTYITKHEWLQEYVVSGTKNTKGTYTFAPIWSDKQNKINFVFAP